MVRKVAKYFSRFFKNFCHQDLIKWPNLDTLIHQFCKTRLNRVGMSVYMKGTYIKGYVCRLHNLRVREKHKVKLLFLKVVRRKGM